MEKNYIFGGLAGALGWYIGDLGELWAWRYIGVLVTLVVLGVFQGAQKGIFWYAREW